MALIKCENCGQEISEYSETCVHCGYSRIIKEYKCKECGNTISEEDIKICPKCGCPVAIDNKTEKQISRLNSANMHNRRKLGIIIAISVVVVISIICIIILKLNNLTGYDKRAYDLILKASVNFKNPSSVRLVSGEFLFQFDPNNDPEEERSLYCKLSATNGFGNRTSSSYWIFENDDGEVHIYEKDDKLCRSIGKLDVEKINKKLESTLGKE